MLSKGLSLLASAALIAGSNGEVCNVLNGTKVNIFDKQGFTADELNIPTLPARLENDGTVQLVNQGEGSSNGQVWMKEQERVAEGFLAEFDFKIEGGGDGLAFVVQNFRDFDILGDNGIRLGYKDRIEAYLGVNFLTCIDQAACAERRVEIIKRSPGNSAVEVVASVPLPSLDCSSGCKGQVAYIEEKVVVFLNDLIVAAGDFGNLQDVLFGSRFAYIGFSSSTSQLASTANTIVSSLKLDLQPANYQVTTKLGLDVVWGRTFSVGVSKADSCQVPIATSELANITAVLELTEREGDAFYNGGGGARITEVGVPTFDAVSEQFVVQFDLPFNIPGKWKLTMEVNDVSIDGSPIDNAVISVPPDADGGIPTWGLALLISLVALIVIGLAYVVLRLRRYRKKLAENKEDIEAGKEKHHLDNLERGVEFKMNPLMGSLDDMRAQLRKNEEELNRLRNGKASQFDDAYTVDQLQAQNADLRNEMNKLKKEAQQNEALGTSFGARIQPKKGGARKQFDQERA